MTESSWKEKWTKEQIKVMLSEQFQAFWQLDPGIERTQLAEIERAAAPPHAVTISGLRRVGKSTLLAQLAHRLGENHFYYVNFEDDRLLGFQAEDANDLYQALLELFGERKVFVIDEVQNIPGWEHFVRRFLDMGFKFYITGSNASLLSRELGSRLTGRYVPVELFPFSFREFLEFRQLPFPDLNRPTTIDLARLQQSLDEYLHLGGIPDPLKYPELPLLRTLYDDVLYRDIATRYRIEEVRALKELAFYLMSNPTGQVSFNKLKDQFHLGSVNTIKNYIEYLENSWLIFTLNVYDYSIKRQQIAAKKIYPIDTGLARAIGFSFSPNTGKLRETAAFLALRRHTKEIYYYTTPTGYEVDFYLPESRQLIQVTQHLDNPATRERELRALTDAMHSLKIEKSLILTDANANPIEENGGTITIRSLAEWLLEDS
ncbi:MAG: ATP-binding protein [Chloroflexi bacterium]|nr:ATP-binding protein [Chloroflexota bacterium]MCI0576407.1 ATP-binding protein [Chloroflexota bacterium]MCI0644279.1 ATP-binding protein [Chloroflexota bacterium]MCI0726262.1 ATP-binding protein [Chloroflexota bacterium]